MESNILQTRAYDRPNSSGTRIKTNRLSNSPGDYEPTYWGVLCRSCIELVAFDTNAYPSFESGSASMNPGSIRCAHGHVHIYFPRDFQFFFSDVSISDVAMHGNREAYRASSPSLQASPNKLDGSEEFDGPYAPTDSLHGMKACLESLVPDAVRQGTRAAVNSHSVASCPPTVKSRDRTWFATIKLFLGMSSPATTR